MMEYKELHEVNDWDQAWEGSVKKPILLFKHSTTCPISAGAFQQYKTYLETADQDINCYLVKVIEDRPVSNQIAEVTGVKHESPQLFLIQEKKVLWNTSHSDISVKSIDDAVQSVAP
ncbi:bacillithiol system redox-active protein YtxJ [Oceanobacillus halophilus]|uniref:Bacillithiol system redox-active protein YtxJ n=1 Tax=Oceanobacillus halophilus TaxID=930130 RepID=A0A495AFU2_9BACI|nr:bacillithiol system redox-active protein YtxJ [Oceanobacillus halophilus]RKQ37605.1 bacillithiol system redox-active protein YtxJ [Oceanobacillus halophilus]